MARQQFGMDYIDVAARIVEFRTKHPEGSLQQVSVDFREFGGQSWVIYTAAAYRTADDARPGMGTAWEPVPGKTNFTRDSELQNAETAAWGRAIVAAMAADTKRGIASAEEVRNRQEERKTAKPPADPLAAAKRDLWDVAQTKGIESLAALTEAFAQWSGGEVLSEVDAARLRAYQAHLQGVAA